MTNKVWFRNGLPVSTKSNPGWREFRMSELGERAFRSWQRENGIDRTRPGDGRAAQTWRRFVIRYRAETGRRGV